MLHCRVTVSPWALVNDLRDAVCSSEPTVNGFIYTNELMKFSIQAHCPVVLSFESGRIQCLEFKTSFDIFGKFLMSTVRS